ncbi:DUF6779 domain-containing protein [Williamsia soli]|uniref:DUF6779 domain-containing protein n=1 Tax=Williamsia soli TaxID=364929 RepID=UPI001A9E2051|nr:DUF6779 domain-containing protein [Williamsia soli]
MTTSAGRSADARRARRGPGQWLLGVLLLFALGSSVFMIITSEMSIAGSLAVITALWAAVIGAILVTKYRRQADSSEAKARDLRLVYELQLEREITARRQYELGVESQIRKEVGAEAGEELRALKSELASLRASLEQLLGELPDERIALVRERLPELEHRSRHTGFGGGDSDRHTSGFAYSEPSFGSAPLVPDDGTVAERDFASTAPPSDQSERGDRNDLTEVIPVVTDDDPLPAEPADPPAAPVSYDPPFDPEAYGSEPDVPQPLDPELVEDSAAQPEPLRVPVAAVDETTVGSAAGRHSGGTRHRAQTPTDEQTADEQPVPAFVDETPTDEWEVAAPPAGGIPDALLADDADDFPELPGAHASGRSVSELLTGFESSAPSGGRRRRRD